MDTMLDAVKKRLKITWTQDDELLLMYIAESMAYMVSLTGVDIDYDTNTYAKSMVYERVRYYYNNAGDEFEVNYAHDLRRLIDRLAVDERKKYAVGDDDYVQA